MGDVLDVLDSGLDGLPDEIVLIYVVLAILLCYDIV